MSSLKVYLKKGAPNYKEKRLITAIETAVQQRMEKDSSFASTFTPARNFEELKKLHNSLAGEDVEYTEVKDTKTDNETSTHEEFRDSVKDSVTPSEDTSDVMGSNIDPFNESNPIVRDYVTDNGFKEEGSENKEKKTTFEEPKDFKESFEMPSSEAEKTNNKKEPINVSGNKKENKKEEPINPSFNEMDSGKKKRSTKKFAKIIVEGVCLLAEKGCIWWTTKDITDDKLIEYQLNDTMDLDILLSLDENQQQPVKEWFRARVKEANTLFKIDDTEKSDLVDSLFEVMMEKGIAPTPMQELIINAVKTFVLDMGVKAYQFNASIQSVISQLTEMRMAEKGAHSHTTTHSHTETTTTTDTDDDTDTDINPATSETSEANQLAIIE